MPAVVLDQPSTTDRFARNAAAGGCMLRAATERGEERQRMAWRQRRDLGARANQIAFDTLHTVSLIAPALREGLTGSGAHRVVRQLRALLGVAAVALAVDER